MTNNELIAAIRKLSIMILEMGDMHSKTMRIARETLQTITDDMDNDLQILTGKPIDANYGMIEEKK